MLNWLLSIIWFAIGHPKDSICFWHCSSLYMPSCALNLKYVGFDLYHTNLLCAVCEMSIETLSFPLSASINHISTTRYGSQRGSCQSWGMHQLWSLSLPSLRPCHGWFRIQYILPWMHIWYPLCGPCQWFHVCVSSTHYDCQWHYYHQQNDYEATDVGVTIKDCHLDIDFFPRI